MLCITHPDVYVHSLELDGALVVEGQQQRTINIDGLKIHNEGWEWQSLKEGNSAKEHEKIRCVTKYKRRTNCDARGKIRLDCDVFVLCENHTSLYLPQVVLHLLVSLCCSLSALLVDMTMTSFVDLAEALR